MKKYLAECIGTMTLVLIGCGTAMLVGCDAANGGDLLSLTVKSTFFLCMPACRGAPTA